MESPYGQPPQGQPQQPYQQPQQPYQQPQQPYQQPGGYGPGGYAPEQGNGQAVAALVLGIVSLVFFWLFFLIFPVICGILAIIFGRIGLNRVNRGETTRNKGMAIAGLVTGILGTIISAALWIAVIVDCADEDGCDDNDFGVLLRTAARLGSHTLGIG
jgi:Domain of unknown function (DUF4190)